MSEQEEKKLCPLCEGAESIPMATGRKKCHHCKGKGKIPKSED